MTKTKNAKKSEKINMEGFKALREASYNLGQELKAQSDYLCCAKVNENFEDFIAKKQENLSFITSKLRLLQAKTVSGKFVTFN